MTTQQVRYTRSPFSRVPIAGSSEGDRVRDQFIADLLALFVDTRLLWLPKKADTTTTTDASRHAATITYDATIAARIALQGSGVSVDFDGDDDEADTPDVARLSFGDGAVDEAFSVVALINPDTDTSAQTIISKQNSATVDEWELHLTATNGYPTFDLIDASSSGIIGRADATAIGTSATLIVATYDGSATVTGINIYKDGALVDDNAGGTTGTYTAMEDTASLVRLGARYTTNERFYNGKMYLAAVVAKELSIDEVWKLKSYVNGFFDLSL